MRFLNKHIGLSVLLIFSIVNVFAQQLRTSGAVNMRISSGTNVIVINQDVNVQNNGTVTSSGSYNITGNVTISGEFQQNAGFVVSGDFSNNGSTSFNTSAFDIEGSIINTGTLNLQTSSIAIAGDIENTGTLNQGTATIEVDGTTDQLLNGLDFVHNLILNKASGNLIANSPIEIENQLNLQNGLFDSSPTSLITIAESASITGGSVNSYVDGPLELASNSSSGSQTLVFPIGKTGEYKPVTIAFEQSDAISTLYSVELITSGIPANTLTGQLTSVSPNRYWAMSHTGVVNYTNLSVTLPLSTDYTVAENEKLFIAKEDVGTWVEVGEDCSNPPLSSSVTMILGSDELDNLIIGKGDRPLADINGGAILCEGESTDLTFNFTGVGPFDVIYTDGTNDVTLDDVTDGFTTSVSPVSTVNFTIRSVVDANGCTVEDPNLNITGVANVTVNPLPTAAIGGDATICEGESTDLIFSFTGGGPYDVVINDGASDIILNDIADGHTENINPTANTTYTFVSVTDANGCVPSSLSGSVTVDVTPLPVVSITDPGSFCTTSGQVNLDASPGAGVWSGPGIIDGNTGLFDPATAGPGLQTITYSADNSGCSTNETIDIEVIATPDPTIDPVAPICTGDGTVTLTAASPTGIWSGTGIVDSNNGTFDPVASGPGTFTVTFDVDNMGCTATDQVDLTVNETLDVNVDPAGPLCTIDAAITLAATPVGGTWSGTGVDPGTGDFDPGAVPVGDYTITYTVDNTGCISEQSITINVLDNPNATITPVSSVCSADAAFNLTAVDPGGTWSGTGITDQATGEFDPSVAGPGVYQISYEINTGSCFDQDQISIEVIETPEITINPVDVICIDDASFSLSASPGGGTWSGTGITDPATGLFNPQVAGVGIFTIAYESNNSGCINSETVEVEVVNNPDASISAVTPVCSQDAPITLSAATSGGTWSGPGITDGANGIFDPSVAQIGQNVIEYAITVGNCTSTNATTITVNETPDATITEVGSICINDAPINLTAATPGGIWSGVGVSGSGIFDPVVAGEGMHVVTYTVTVNGCDNTDEAEIEVIPLPDLPGVPVGPRAFCVNEEVTFTSGQIRGAEVYRWTTPIGQFETQRPELVITFGDVVQGDIIVTGINSCGAGSSSDPLAVEINPLPQVDFIFEKDPGDLYSYQFTDNSSSDVVEWIWDFGEGGTSEEQNPFYSYTESGEFNVVLAGSTALGCTSTATRQIVLNIEIDFTIGNLITNNNNGLNDFIFIENIELYQDHVVELYNRWGKKIFESSSFSNDPNEIVNKPDLEAGNYLCRVTVRVDGQEVRRQQIITVTN